MRILDIRKRGVPPGYATLTELSYRWGKSLSWLETVCRERIGRIGAGAVLVPVWYDASRWFIKVDPAAKPIEDYMEETGLKYGDRWCVRDLVVETGVPAAKIRRFIDDGTIEAELTEVGHYVSYQFNEENYRRAINVLEKVEVMRRRLPEHYSYKG